MLPEVRSQALHFARPQPHSDSFGHFAVPFELLPPPVPAHVLRSVSLRHDGYPLHGMNEDKHRLGRHRGSGRRFPAVQGD